MRKRKIGYKRMDVPSKRLARLDQEKKRSEINLYAMVWKNNEEMK